MPQVAATTMCQAPPLIPPMTTQPTSPIIQPAEHFLQIFLCPFWPMLGLSTSIPTLASSHTQASPGFHCGCGYAYGHAAAAPGFEMPALTDGFISVKVRVIFIDRMHGDCHRHQPIRAKVVAVCQLVGTQHIIRSALLRSRSAAASCGLHPLHNSGVYRLNVVCHTELMPCASSS